VQALERMLVFVPKRFMMNQKAFTLVEIAVAAVIVGILAMVAVTNMTRMSNRAYARDAYQNLTAIYIAQQDYAQNHGGTFDGSATLAGLNTNLKMNIVSTNGIIYSCAALSQCSATMGTVFTMKIHLRFDLKTSRPEYCGGADPSSTNNPCCQGGTAGDPCP
jgi:prepilin-type N-terminal cleavage/methylation domain-containing protein